MLDYRLASRKHQAYTSPGIGVAFPGWPAPRRHPVWSPDSDKRICANIDNGGNLHFSRMSKYLCATRRIFESQA
ncbi:hypothetical protein DP23_4119 [Ralstonia pickettii]|nr:hypothetical protein DP23_4119 [Ralstonia pickettii]